MLPQTNLQLYRLLIEQDWGNDDLALVRRGYELAVSLFANRCRPGGKPFTCHVVGAAGALARWGQRPTLVVAGLLHSAYPHGEFGDGQRPGARRQRRRKVAAIVGADVERLVHGYATQDWGSLAGITDRDIVTLRLADRLDEVIDAGPAYGVGKPTAQFRLAEPAEDSLIAIAGRVVGPSAAEDFRQALAQFADAAIPDCLTCHRRASYTVEPGVEGLRRPAVWARVVRISEKLTRKKAA